MTFVFRHSVNEFADLPVEASILPDSAKVGASETLPPGLLVRA